MPNQDKSTDKHLSRIINADDIKHTYILAAFSILSIAFTLPLGLYAFVRDNSVLAVMLLTISLIAFIDLMLLFRKHISHTTASHLLLIPVLILMLYLVGTGGVDNSGPLWIYAIPAITFFLYGMKRGLFVLSIFLAAVILILFIPTGLFHTDLHYSFDYKLRLVLVFLLVSALTLAYAYSTQEVFDHMHTITSKLSSLVDEDQLTGLYNRRGIQRDLENLHKQWIDEERNFSVILCDIDFFKDINDRYGHQVGDQVLSEIANIIKQSIRRSDMAARWGGEEFLIVLPDASQREAYQVAEKIRNTVLMFSFYHHMREIKVSLSSGVAQMRDADSIDDLIRQADNYMYQAKAKGRNITMPFFLTNI